MKRLFLSSGLALTVLLSSCVSKKKYTELEDELEDTESQLYKKNEENESNKDKLNKIQSKVDDYYAKINDLKEENAEKLEVTEEGNAVSKNAKKSMRETLKNVDSDKLAEAQTLNDSMDLAVSYNLMKSLGAGEDDEDIDVNVDRTVVEIKISDNLLFRSGSYMVNPNSYGLLSRIADLAKSESSVEALVEGHADAQTVVDSSYIEDNWDLSVRRSTAVVRLLQNKYDVDGEQLIASGRSSYKPVADNDTAEGRQKNRRTRIVILPNLDKFLAMLEEG